MKTRDEQREDRREYHNDVAYDVWRAGGNPDAVDYDCVEDYFYDGRRHEDAARFELKKQHLHPPQPEQEEPDEDAENA